MTFKYSAIAATLGALCACSPPAEKEDAGEATDNGDHVWQDQTDTLDKARDLENTLMDAEKKRREQLEDPQPEG